MKRLILLTVLFTMHYTAKAQGFEWLQTPEADITLNPDMIGYCTATDASGNLYFAGFKDTPTPYNDILGRLYFNKYNPAGTPAFEKIIEGKAQVYNIVTDSNNNSIVAFGWINTITIDELNLSTVNQGMQFLMVKFDSNGQLLWYKQMLINDSAEPGLDGVEEFRALAIDNQGNIYAAYNNYMDGYITKYSPGGNEMFSIVQTNVARISSLALDTEGNIIASGSCINWDATFAGITVETDFSYTDYIVKYSPTGQYQWMKIIESITCGETHVVANGPDEIYWAGALYGTVAFGDIITTESATNNGDFYLARLNAEGTFQWVHQTPEGGSLLLGHRNFLNVDNQGNVYIAGRVSSDIDWGNGVISNGTGLYKTAIVLKYNNQGVAQTAKIATSEYLTRFDSASITPEGDIYVAGVAMGESTFAPLTYNPDNEQVYYPFSAKLSNNTTGVDNPEQEIFTIYPNPVSDLLYLKGTTDSASISVYTISGQKVADYLTSDGVGIDVHNFASGVYIVKDALGRFERFIKK